jgi:hypothetical protein
MFEKIFRKASVLILLILAGGFLMTNTARADIAGDDVIGDCTITGYAFMGGSGKQSTSDGLNPSQRTYFKAQPLTYMYEGTDMWGYAWLKFDNLSETAVDSAYLALDLLGVGGMAVEDASADYPGLVSIYSPGNIDVADLWASDANPDAAAAAQALRITLHDNLLEDTALVADFIMPSNGTWYIDITDIYNAWVTGEAENNGLALVSNSENDSGEIGSVGAMFAGFNNPSGNAPYITASPVPVPGAVWLLGSGLAGLIGLRRRNGKRRLTT